MNNYETFFYWINERERIRIAKGMGLPKPWTSDAILRQYKFTNVFRQDDKTTRALLRHLNEHVDADPVEIFFNIVLFRMFNWAPTYEYMGGWCTRFSASRWKNKLTEYKNKDNKIFTGAYVITNAGRTTSKIEFVCEMLKNMWDVRKKLAKEIISCNSIEKSVDIMAKCGGIGNFVAYELACDLTYTHILEEAPDRFTWANPGPGAHRGLNRIFRGTKHEKVSRKQCIEEMRTLFAELPKRCEQHIFESRWPMDMRVVENGLCEVDKYLRVKNGEGRPRSRYPGV